MFDKHTLCLIRLWIIAGTLLFITTGVCIVYFTLGNWKNAYDKTQAEIQILNKQAELVGKDTVIINRHEYPER